MVDETGADTREDRRAEDEYDEEAEDDDSLGALGGGKISPRSAANKRRVILGMTPWRQASRMISASIVSSTLPKNKHPPGEKLQ